MKQGFVLVTMCAISAMTFGYSGGMITSAFADEEIIPITAEISDYLKSPVSVDKVTIKSQNKSEYFASATIELKGKTQVDGGSSFSSLGMVKKNVNGHSFLYLQ